MLLTTGFLSLHNICIQECMYISNAHNFFSFFYFIQYFKTSLLVENTINEFELNFS